MQFEACSGSLPGGQRRGPRRANRGGRSRRQPEIPRAGVAACSSLSSAMGGNADDVQQAQHHRVAAPPGPSGVRRGHGHAAFQLPAVLRSLHAGPRGRVYDAMLHVYPRARVQGPALGCCLSPARLGRRPRTSGPPLSLSRRPPTPVHHPPLLLSSKYLHPTSCVCLHRRRVADRVEVTMRPMRLAVCGHSPKHPIRDFCMYAVTGTIHTVGRPESPSHSGC
jgi:hypothetical protein